MTQGPFIASITGFADYPVPSVIAELDGTVVATNSLVRRLEPGDKVWRVASELEGEWRALVPVVATRGRYQVEMSIGGERTWMVAVPREHEGHRYILVCFINLAPNEHEVRIVGNQRLESLGLVAGGVAHEFNNQLVSVVADASTLREDEALSDSMREAVARIDGAARRMTQLTRQLLAFAGRGRFVTTLLDPCALVSDTRHRLTRIVPPTVALTIAVNAGTVAVEADRGLLRQMIVDLVENAADAVAGSGAISVTSRVHTQDNATQWELEVRDDGVGMDASTLSRMFDPFFTTKPDHRGLGLSAVLGIARRLGGDITATSEVGKGTTVLVRLPVVPGVVPPRRRTTSEQAPIEKLTGLKILVADDEPSVRQTVQRLLVRRGAVPVIACDGAEAEQLMRTQQFDVLLFDIMMPKRTGYQLIPIAHEVQPNDPVILMSGYSEQARGVEAPDAFIEKPFDAAMLESAIQSALRGEVNSSGSESDITEPTLIRPKT